MNPKEMARLFHDEGYGVVGIHPAHNGLCECGNPECLALWKHPSMSSWQNIPVPWSDEQFDVMDTLNYFDTGFGVLTKNRLLVVDVDARNGGVASYERLLEKCPDVASAGLVVNTGSGGGSKHLYFKAPADVALLAHLKDYPGVDFRSGSGAFVVGPGSMHASGRRYEAVLGSPDDIEDAPASLIELLRRPATVRVEYDGKTMDVSQADVASMLSCIPNNDVDYDTFIQIGMAVHHSTGGAGYSLWDTWAQSSSKYDESQMHYWWTHMGKHPVPVTVGTLIHHAELNGWVRPVDISEAPEIEPTDEMPCDIDGIDLRRPPGFVGKVAEWIAAQPRRKRENIAVGAALVAVGNHVGMRMVDARDGMTANLIAFGVAGSGTGKESVQQAFAELHRETGISGAVHGSIKSDAEIYRNLTRHQAAFYNVDEISDFLEKLNNAKKKGGAAYLDSVVATIMSVFTKANGYLLLTGDAKEALKEDMRKEAAKEQKKLDDGGGSETVLARLLIQMDEIDKGLKHPFLSMCGYGTPAKFHDLMDFRSATEGFFGRAMIFEEKDSAPRMKAGYKTTPMPADIKDTMSQLFYGGEYDTPNRRVEHRHERIKVPTDHAAGELLDRISLWMDEKAMQQASTSGLEAMFLRGYELVAKVSFILAAPHGLRTSEHVRWAFALVMRDLELKTMLVTSNDRKMDAPATALQAKVMAHMDKEDWTGFGVLFNKCRGYKREEVEGVLQKLVDSGVLDVQEVTHPTNGRVSKKYRRNG